MSLTRKVAFNTITQLVGKILNLGITFVLVALLTRNLGVAGYGQFTLAFSIVTFFAVFADFGFFTILVRELSAEKHDQEKIANNILTLRTIIAAIIFLFAYIIAQFINNYDPVVRHAILFTATAQFILAVQQTIAGIFQAKFRIDKAVVSDIVGKILIVALVYLYLQRSIDFQGVIKIYIVGNFVTFALTFFQARQFIRIKPAFDFSFWKYVLRNSISISILLILSTIYFRNDMMILGIFKSSVDVGIYGVAYKVFEVLISFPTFFLGASFPIFSKYIADKERMKGIFQKSLEFMVILSVPLTFGGMFFASKIIGIIGGGEFLHSSTINLFGQPMTSVNALQILMSGMFFMFLTNLFNYIILASNRQKILILPNICFLVFNLSLNLILIPKYSYIAGAFTTALSELVIFITTWFVLSKQFDYKFESLSIIWKASLSALVMLVVANAFIALNFFIVLPICAVIYFLTLSLLGGIKKDIFKELFKSQSLNN